VATAHTGRAPDPLGPPQPVTAALRHHARPRPDGLCSGHGDRAASRATREARRRP
jgi:hypothetical protein